MSAEIFILNTTNIKNIEVNLNNHVKTKAGCGFAFVVWFVHNDSESKIQVIGDTVLEPKIHAFISQDANSNDIINVLNDHREVIPSFPSKVYTIHFQHPESEEISFLYCLADCPELAIELSNEITQLIRNVSAPIITAFSLEMEKRRKEQSQVLLAIAKNLFLHLGDLVDLIQEIIQEGRKLTGCERCSLFLVSEDRTELIAKVFDGVPREQSEELRLPISQGIAGYVATTGETLTIRDAYSHPLFYKNLDEQTGFTTKNMLCFPIRDCHSSIVGVVQLCNKPSGFTALDEEASRALATYCGISLMHSIVYKKIKQSQARSRLANELLMHHMKVSEESVQRVVECTESHDTSSMLDWKWPCREAPPNITPCLALSMFETLGFLTAFHINRSTLSRFLLVIRKGYREVPYHNWLHAFSAAHFSFCVMKSMELVEKSIITEIEGVALLVASFCHDIDHRGTTNSFQTKSKNSLACLYSSEGSVMEQHHFAQTLCILNTDGCNIFENLDTSSYRRVLDVIRDLILATDVMSHLNRQTQQRAVAMSFDASQKEHRSQMLALLITCADLSDQVKGWSYTRHIANLIYDEFFAQGDLEKAMGSQPAEMMDRERAEIPVQQIQFITEICLPSYQLLAIFLPQLEPCVMAVEESLLRWKVAKKWFNLPEHEGRLVLSMLNDPRLELFVFDERNT